MNGIFPSGGAVFLTSLPAGVFDDLTSLTTLNSRDNDFTSLPAGVFDKLTSLTTLNLGGNELTSLPAGVFDKLTSLTMLHLDVNALTSLPDGVFDKLTSLTTLFLNHNALTSLPDGVFDKLTRLRNLYLHNNALTSLRQDVFSHTRSISGGNRIILIPSAPQNMGATNSGRDVTVVWQPPAHTGFGITSYKLRWREQGAGSFADADVVFVGASVRSHAISGLDAGTEYELQVAALSNQVDNLRSFATLLAVTPIAGNYAGIRHTTAVAVPGAPKSVRAAPAMHNLSSLGWRRTTTAARM